MDKRKYDIDNEEVYISLKKYKELSNSRNVVKVLHQAGISRQRSFYYYYYDDVVEELSLYRDKKYNVNPHIKKILQKKNENDVSLSIFEYMKLSDYNKIYKALDEKNIKDTNFYKDTVEHFLGMPQE
jgi:hypothetical protein